MSYPAVPLIKPGSGYTMVIHVVSPQMLSGGEQCQASGQNPLGKFLKGEPKALGTTQIIIGLFNFAFGIAKAIAFYPDLSLYSGVFFWGSLFYVVSGSLTVMASNKLNHCLVVATMVMNIFSAISSGIGIILFSLDVGLMDRHYYNSCRYSSPYLADCRGTDMSKGVTAVMLVFAILQFVISICISAFCCKACCHKSPPINIMVSDPVQSMSTTIPLPVYSIQQEMNMTHNTTMFNPHMENPPEYPGLKAQPDQQDS